jgi:hypothetical protein
MVCQIGYKKEQETRRGQLFNAVGTMRTCNHESPKPQFRDVSGVQSPRRGLQRRLSASGLCGSPKIICWPCSPHHDDNTPWLHPSRSHCRCPSSPPGGLARRTSSPSASSPLPRTATSSLLARTSWPTPAECVTRRTTINEVLTPTVEATPAHLLRG